MKACSKCGISKPEIDFYKDSSHSDGLRSQCKSCQITKQQNYYGLHKNQKKEYDVVYREKNREKYRAKCRRYYQEHKLERLEYWRKYKSLPENREREIAGAVARFQIDLTGQQCSVCGSKENLERHHPDYSKPSEVVILCREHHNELKRKPV